MDEENYIYQAVDHSNDEGYLELGIWSSLEEAISSLDNLPNNPFDAGVFDSDYDGYIVVNIHKRKMGFSAMGRTVHQFEWTREYDENDEPKWVVTNQSLLN